MCVKVVARRNYRVKSSVELGARINVSGDKLQIQVISVPECQSLASEVIQSLGSFRKAIRSTHVR